MPTFERPKQLSHAIESVLNQSFSNFEIIVADDGIVTEAKRVAMEFNDSRIKYFKNEQNLGIVRNVNNCILHSRGEIITFLEDDCRYVDSEYLNKLNTIFTDNVECNVCFASQCFWEDDDHNVKKNKQTLFFPYYLELF